MVYGSNVIERAGNGPDITLKLCMAIFRGEIFRGEDIPEDALSGLFCKFLAVRIGFFRSVEMELVCLLYCGTQSHIESSTEGSQRAD